MEVYQDMLCIICSLSPAACAELANLNACADVPPCLPRAAFQVMEVYQDMLRTGCERSVITYSALISACEKAGQWQLALNLFGEMLRERCTPNVITYNSLITACAQVGPLLWGSVLRACCWQVFAHLLRLCHLLMFLLRALPV